MFWFIKIKIHSFAVGKLLIFVYTQLSTKRKLNFPDYLGTILLDIETLSFANEGVLCAKNNFRASSTSLAKMACWCQFHQHFTSSFFVGKCFEKLFCTYIVGLYFFVARKLAQTLLIKCWWNWPLCFNFTCKNGMLKLAKKRREKLKIVQPHGRTNVHTSWTDEPIL